VGRAAILVLLAGLAGLLPGCATDRARRLDEHLRVEAPDGLEEDARNVRAWVADAAAALRSELGDRGDPLAGLELDVVLHASESGRARAGKVLVQEKREGGRRRAEIHLLAPATQPTSARTPEGEPVDQHFFRRALTSAIASLFLDGITRAKGAGWKLSDAPEWFARGYAEYLGLALSDNHERTVTQDLVLHEILREPDRISPAGTGIRVKDPVQDGEVLVLFLHESLGREKVRALLESPEPAFDRACERVLGATPDGLLPAFRKWLARKWMDTGHPEAAR